MTFDNTLDDNIVIVVGILKWEKRPDVGTPSASKGSKDSV
jgi:hypothetical protein